MKDDVVPIDFEQPDLGDRGCLEDQRRSVLSLRLHVHEELSP